MTRMILLSISALASLAACTSSEMGATGQTVQRVANTGPATLGNTLPQSGQGNSGGVLAVQGQPPAAGVEATMAYNARGISSGARVDFHNGDMSGVGVRCTRAGGGAVVPECTAVNANSAYLVNELHGTHSYVGAFAVNGYGPTRTQDGFVAIHASPGATNPVLLPGAAVDYRGQFQSGGSIISGGRAFSGRASGSMDLTADFAAGAIDAAFSGHLRDDATGDYTTLAAGFADAVIDPNGRFFNNSNTTFSYGNAQAWGELDGAFYGPNAEEAAGTFGFGNSQGGMTGVMIGCSEYNPANCIAPAPRF